MGVSQGRGKTVDEYWGVCWINIFFFFGEEEGREGVGEEIRDPRVSQCGDSHS